MFRVGERFGRIVYAFVLIAALSLAVPAALFGDGEPPIWDPKTGGDGGGGVPTTVRPDGVADPIANLAAVVFQMLEAI